MRCVIGLLRWHENLAAHVAAFLFARQLIFQMNSRRAGFDHCLHQFENIERAAKAGFRIRDDRSEPVDVSLSLGMMDLVGPLQRLVDPLHHRRNAVRRIKTLVGIHVSGEIRVGRNLPAAQIDRFQSRFHLLHGLVAG